MKQIVFAAAAALGMTTFADPAQALNFKWNVDYTGFFAEGAAITGSFIAEESAAADGFVSGDEFDSWLWNWSGNSEVEAFSVASTDGGVLESFFGPAGFFVDGTPNLPGVDPSEGFYVSDDVGLDLDFLLVENFTAGSFSGGNLTTAGTVTVSDPEVVPEPGTSLGLLTLAGAAALAKRQKQAA